MVQEGWGGGWADKSKKLSTDRENQRPFFTGEKNGTGKIPIFKKRSNL
jgi:hypothetical protein